MTLVSTHWLDENSRKVKIIDCSWHMPLTQRDGYNEYLEEHIPEAIFFDIDKNSEPNTDLPHMLPKASYFQKIVSELGINNEDKIVIYDNSDVFSACRCWFSFFYFGHNSKKLSVLNGGLKKWKLENKIISKKIKLNDLEKGVVCEFKLDELKAPLSKRTVEYLKEQGIIMDKIIQLELKEVKIIDENSEDA